MTSVLKCLSMLSLVFGTALTMNGCHSDGPTTRIDYTYQKPIWTDASFEKPAAPRKAL